MSLGFIPGMSYDVRSQYRFQLQRVIGWNRRLTWMDPPLPLLTAHRPAPHAIKSGGAPDIGAGPGPNSQVNQFDDDDDDDDIEWDDFHPLPMLLMHPIAPYGFGKSSCPAWPDNFPMVRLQMCTHLRAQPITSREKE